MAVSRCWITIAERVIDSKEPALKFWTGVNVFTDRPHLVNRKLLATEVLQKCTLPKSSRNLSLDFHQDDFHNLIKCIFKCTDGKQSSSIEVVPLDFVSNENDKEAFTLTFRKLVPRNISKFAEVFELVLKDEEENIVIFWPKESDVLNSTITPAFPYRIRLIDDLITVEVYKSSSKSNIRDEASEDWLKLCVLPKIVKWCCFSSSSYTVPSLSLVSAKRYSLHYNYLKEKYGKKYIETWPESTDPVKYVFEDIAIAAYLMTIWRKEREDLNISSKQTFVDLGCGNGLLVDLLTAEGHQGIGIDVRKRNIWDFYDKSTILIEKTIEPSDYNLFPDYDWIIGNHSDELTPWIPVIAARSSYKMRVFLLPCCAFTFNGKFDRDSSGKPLYQSYLSFIHRVCEYMGFVVHEDRLRIPSTKRVCTIGLA